MARSVLIDTHVLIWMRTEPERLVAREREALQSAPRCYVSAASLWEIAILMALGRLGRENRLLQAPEGCDLLPILPPHLAALIELPFHHRDPFDRMLIAQARAERLDLITRDKIVAQYATPRE